MKNKSVDGDHVSNAESGKKAANKQKTADVTSEGPSSSPFKFLEVEDTPSPCRICTKTIGKNAKSLMCDRCNGWVHLGCSDVSSSQYSFLESSVSDSFKWFCKHCEDDCKTISPGDRLAEQSAKLETLFEIVRTMQQQNQLILQLLQNENRLEEKIKVQVTEVLDAQKEKEERKSNVILFNVQESENDEKSQETAHDMAQVEKILKTVHPGLQWHSSVTKSVVRLGRKKSSKDQHSKPRPIRVSFADAESKLEILRNAKKLRGSGFQNVGIAPDKTLAERKEDLAKRTEFKERKARGDDVVWHKGKVMLKSERDKDQSREKGAENGLDRGTVGGASN